MDVIGFLYVLLGCSIVQLHDSLSRLQRAGWELPRSFLYILSRVWGLKTGFGLVIGCINHLQVVTTINYYTIAHSQNLQSLHTNLLSLFPLVFTDL
jgi:hypothetical protein